jgi:hypothetical protein
LEKDSGILRLIVSLWDEGGGSPCPGWPRQVAGRPAHVAKRSPICPYCAVVEIKRKIVEGKEGKKGESGQPAINLWPSGHTWPPLDSHFHSSPHLAPLMLTQLIKSKANSLHLFSMFYLFLFEIFRFYDMQ